MRRFFAVSLLVLPALVQATPLVPPCPDAGALRVAVEAAGQPDAARDDRDELVMALVDCLGHPDPAVRDDLAYGTLTAWLRADAIAPPMRTELMADLLADLSPDFPDPRGFRPPFAALVLSEVARTDRVAAWMTDEERSELVIIAAEYLSNVRDYRGFVDGEGWRHGVAHGADLVMQLVLNPALDAPARRRLLDAVAAQVAPPGAPPYVHTEPERLARPVLLALGQESFDAAQWSAWVAALAAPAPMANWGEAWQSEAGLARRHNLRAFLMALHVGLSGREDAAAWQAPVAEALRAGN